MDQQTAKKIMQLTNQSYQKIADVFSDSRNFPWPEIEEVIKKYIKSNDHILDLGCGNGRLLKSLKSIEKFNYTGLDNCSTLVTEAQKSAFAIFSTKASINKRTTADRRQNTKTLQDKNNIKIDFIHDNMLNLSQFARDEFDAVFMIASLCHIPSTQLRQQIMVELRRILKPGGYLIMTNWNLWNVKNKKSVWCRKGLGNKEYGISNLNFKDVITLWQNKHPLYYYAFTKTELNKLFKNSGFKVLKNNYVKRGQPAHWWNAYNILSVEQK